MTTGMLSRSRSTTLAGTTVRWMSTAASAEAVAETGAVKKSGGGGNMRLYQRLSALGKKEGLVASTINKYIREGKKVHKEELNCCVRELRRFGRHRQALEIMEWIDTRKMALSSTDLATRLDLISKVHGVGAAEKYFNDLVPQQKNKYTYGALLNCYCVEKMKDEALALFDRMGELKIESTSLAFSNLMSLHMRLGEFEKVNTLVEEMKKREVPLSTFSYNIWMTSSSHLGDIQGVERVFEEIKQEGESKCDWTTYSNLAVAYVRAGLKEKAELALKMLEQRMKPPKREAFHYLLSIYASIYNSDEVHRIWKSLKLSFRATTNVSYLNMVRALSKLNDIDGLKKLFEEWELTCSSYDMRLANAAIGAYLRNGLVDEAETILRNVQERSNGPFGNAWELLMIFYLENRDLQNAFRCLEGATHDHNDSGWQPGSDSINKFLNCIEEGKDVDSAEVLFKLLKKVHCLKRNVYKSLLKTYIGAGRMEPNMRERIEGDGIEIDRELESLLNVCCK
ncbi:OLC1v1036516C1 [Oldenlandia corymbosa var. corymbosa]|uniref:OLC1v1036516C1 n=1 Tax=Oldenlandia corymbosa var. corymbosa TaxID=529605 RepID=A0AAV1CXI8_OLDCO|nr:OLC1v1036516C1 [Oldenlandia corymbosa var. corymbosa]